MRRDQNIRTESIHIPEYFDIELLYLYFGKKQRRQRTLSYIITRLETQWLFETGETTSLRRRVNCDVIAYVTRSSAPTSKKSLSWRRSFLGRKVY